MRQIDRTCWPGSALLSKSPLHLRSRGATRQQTPKAVVLISSANLCQLPSCLLAMPPVRAYFFLIIITFFTGLTFMIYDRWTDRTSSCVGDGGGTHSSGDDVVSHSFLWRCRRAQTPHRGPFFPPIIYYYYILAIRIGIFPVLI